MTPHAVPVAPVARGRRAVVTALLAMLAALGLGLSLPSGSAQAAPLASTTVSADASAAHPGHPTPHDDALARVVVAPSAPAGRADSRPWTSAGERAQSRPFGHHAGGDPALAPALTRLLAARTGGPCDDGLFLGPAFRPSSADPARAPPA